MGATKRDRSPQVPELTAPQIAAVDALISGATDSEAASAAGVHRSTLNKWSNHHPGFVAALNSRRGEIWASSRERLRALLPAALDRVEREIGNPTSPGGLRAALRVIEAGMSGASLRESGPTDALMILDGIARRRRGPSTEEILADFADHGDNSGPITDKERRAALKELEELGAFDGD